VQIYCFGEYELDLDARQLRMRGKPVQIERRPLDLLILLVGRHGSMVSREDIIASLWSAKIIIDFDSGINTLVRKVRNALGDSSDDPKFIETVSGRGYRFIAPVTTPTLINSDPEQQMKKTLLRFWRPVTPFVLMLLVFGAAIVFWQSNSMEHEQTRIAVLPFENLSGDDQLGYLASGLAEETNMSLAQMDLPNLSVIGGVSTRALADSASSLPEIGRKLGVDFFVLSSLRQSKPLIRITSRLIRVADGEQVWSASFDRELINVLGLQRELSIAIAEQIRQRLSPEVAAAIDRRQTRNPEAYQLYLKGRFEWTQFQPNAVPRALEYYRQAVAKDPGYGLAWAGIAHALITSSVTAEANRQTITPAAQDALQRALEFGPELAETQLALGSFHFFLVRDLPAAEAAARQAVSLDPNSAMAHMFVGLVLSERHKHVEALAMLRRARELDPLFPLMFANSAVVALAAGEPQKALEFATQAVAISPEFWPGYLHLGSAYVALGDYAAAELAYSNAERLSGYNSASASSSRAFVLAKLGRKEDARDILAELMSRSADHYVPPYSIAVAYTGLADIDSAFSWLERAVADDSIWCSDLSYDNKLDALRLNLRFESLIKHCESKSESYVLQ
jgi:TolB-like protein/DNA-binding winged helix-turn-helix (wHTH) protein/Tfp pilus assembly protein PilF